MSLPPYVCNSRTQPSLHATRRTGNAHASLFRRASNGHVVAADQAHIYEYLVTCDSILTTLPRRQRIQPPTALIRHDYTEPKLSGLSFSPPPQSPPPQTRALSALSTRSLSESASTIFSSSSSSSLSKNHSPSVSFSYSAADEHATTKTAATTRAQLVDALLSLDNAAKVFNTCCTNCRTTTTSVWRKDDAGQPVCNACGLFRKQRGFDRPASFPFRKAVVRRRNRGGKIRGVEDDDSSEGLLAATTTGAMVTTA
ncbi:hypothetical protein HK100_007729 [Physocladia obscura]|uniref:GATA-type domain-containing protein n=1 Tax=Physocladia obscura TaxID=109957 RepID=A0AAD5TAD3_9FUNG|nr:hypothetical protein HK100_007729 [Physocladia obscura]